MLPAPTTPFKDLSKEERVIYAAQAMQATLSPSGMLKLLRRGKSEFVRAATGVENLGDGFSRDELPDIYDYLLRIVGNQIVTH